MALLGYPREHTVPRETWRPWRTQPNPARILTLEPELAAHPEKRGVKLGLSLRCRALKRLVTSDTQRRTPLLSSTRVTRWPRSIARSTSCSSRFFKLDAVL